MRFLLLTRTDWNEPPRSRHQLARSLAKNHTVIFVSANILGKPGLEYSINEKNITVVSPTWFIQNKLLWRLPFLNELYQVWLYSKLKRKYSDCIIINFDVSSSLLSFYFNNIIFYCGDNFLATNRSKLFLISVYWFFTQKLIAQQAIFCVSVSTYLQQKMAKYNNSSYLLLTAAGDTPNTENIYLKNKKIKKNILYVGWIAKLEFDWVIELSKNSDYNIIIIGPGSHIQKLLLERYKNIDLTGPKTGEELIPYLSNADVCIAPYVDNLDTEKVYTMPNKFWLYLSYGKPIVTRKINNLANLPDCFVYQSKDLSAFIKNINKAISDNSQALFEQRQIFISKNTWDNRTKEIKNLIESHKECFKL